MSASALMLQGTGSDVGKSLLVAGLARAYTRRGLRVRPFKPQNMSNNAAVTADGGEIGRAQALQARACGVLPSVHMNPVLLKPQSEVGAQIVVQGRVWRSARATEYFRLKSSLLPKVLESFQTLREQCDLVLVEGAGSAAEVNLRAGDIANMGFAVTAKTPVVLVGDIDRGGVIASIVGTAELLEEADRAQLRGYIINRFRGDPALFDDGLTIIGERTGLRCLGVLPYFAQARNLPPEDSVALERPPRASAATASLRIAVPVLARIANFDDLDPLLAEPDVEVRFVHQGQALPGDADLVILPGSKSTLADLRDLRRAGWHIDIEAHLRRGGWLLGLCGGYQMLGREVHDAQGIEGPAGTEAGLGHLDLVTCLEPSKTLVEVSGRHLATGEDVRGYEMHIGRTEGADRDRPFLELAGRTEGAVTPCGRIMGTYLHGLFGQDRFRHAFLRAIRHRDASGIDYETQVDTTLDQLANHLEEHLDLDVLLEIATAGAHHRPAAQASAKPPASHMPASL